MLNVSGLPQKHLSIHFKMPIQHIALTRRREFPSAPAVTVVLALSKREKRFPSRVNPPPASGMRNDRSMAHALQEYGENHSVGKLLLAARHPECCGLPGNLDQ